MNLARDFDKDSVKMDRGALAEALQQAGARNTGRPSIRCPFHDDRTPSAYIKRADSGAWYFYCYVCGISEDVFGVRALTEGRSPGEILKGDGVAAPSPRYRPPRQDVMPDIPQTPAAVYKTLEELITAYRERNPGHAVVEENRYENDTGGVDLFTLRVRREDGKKSFVQATPTPARDGWIMRGLSGVTPLYNRPAIAKAGRVLVVEGEKCARAVTELGITNLAATTSPGGSHAAKRADWSPLAGKSVWIWPDNDTLGFSYAADVEAAVRKLTPPCSVYRVDPAELGLGEKEDVADYIESCAGSTTAELAAAIEGVLGNVGSGIIDLRKHFAAIGTGDYRLVPLVNQPEFSALSQATLPGTVTSIVGSPGGGKSFLALENCWRWTEAGENVRLLMLEEDVSFHQKRALAQMSGQADLLDVTFTVDNPQWGADLLETYAERLEKFAAHIEAPGSRQMSLDEIAEWVEHWANAGVRVLWVDPVTAAKVSDKPWVDDQRFLFRVKSIVERTGTSVILNTHPRVGPAGKPSLDGQAGGAAYPRFSQTVAWLVGLESPRSTLVTKGYFTETVEYRHVLQIRKARNGTGQGKNIAMRLNKESLCFDELGVVIDG